MNTLQNATTQVFFPVNIWGNVYCNCYITIQRHETRPPVVIISEPTQNPGRSVTNSQALVIPAIIEKFNLPENSLWIEHYKGEGSFDRVQPKFSRERGKLVVTDVTWRMLTKEERGLVTAETWSKLEAIP